jgi:hypothetical protein
MGTTLSVIENILSKTQPTKSVGLKVLDVGCQNLYLTEAEQVVRFFEKWKPSHDSKSVKQYAEMIAAGSEIDPSVGGLNGAWLGDILSKAGFSYLSYDIFDGYNTFVFDLNRDSVPRDQFGTFDVVLNCGTSEHVLGQFNCFKVIHDAVRTGGVMYHEVPFTGYLDHGYFNYQPRLFFDLAKANGYEIIEASVGEPAGTENAVDRILDPYQRIGVSLGSQDRGWKTQAIPTSGFSILFRKMVDAPFRVALETSTTAGTVKQTIRGFYEKYSGKASADSAAARAPRTVDSFQRDMLCRLHDPKLGHEEIMAFYRAFVASFPGEDFPLELEKKSLILALERWPDRQDMHVRLSVVEGLILQKYPLLNHVVTKLASVEEETAPSLFDGSELKIRALALGGDRIDQILGRFYAYFEAGQVREFPADLELEAIKSIIKKFGANPDLKLRLGYLLSGLTKAFDLSA